MGLDLTFTVPHGAISFFSSRFSRIFTAFFSMLFQQGTPQRLPKRLRFVVDVSGSMYRFNSLDGRLGRMMEAACLVMEAFHQYDNKIKVHIKWQYIN